MINRFFRNLKFYYVHRTAISWKDHALGRDKDFRDAKIFMKRFKQYTDAYGNFTYEEMNRLFQQTRIGLSMSESIDAVKHWSSMARK